MKRHHPSRCDAVRSSRTPPFWKRVLSFLHLFSGLSLLFKALVIVLILIVFHLFFFIGDIIHSAIIMDWKAVDLKLGE